MPNLLPERWKESLEQIQEKAGQFLNKLRTWKKQETSPERLTADLIPTFMQSGGPFLDMHEKNDEYIIRIELPGLKKEDINIEIVGRRLTIKGEKKIVKELKGDAGYIVSECRYGSFSRAIQLPCEPDEGKINSFLADGVLTVRIAKPEKRKDRLSYHVPVS